MFVTGRWPGLGSEGRPNDSTWTHLTSWMTRRWKPCLQVVSRLLKSEVKLRCVPKVGRRAINLANGLGAKSPGRGAKGTSSMMAAEGIGSYLQNVSRAREADESCRSREEKLAAPMKEKVSTKSRMKTSAVGGNRSSCRARWMGETAGERPMEVLML